MSFKVPECNRISKKEHKLYGSDKTYKNNGAFKLEFKGYDIFCIASDGEGWEHVSITINRNRTPSWDIMCFIKDTFWDDNDVVIQFHVSKKEHINNHDYCLHLWRKIGQEYETPNKLLVGVVL